MFFEDFISSFNYLVIFFGKLKAPTLVPGFAVLNKRPLNPAAIISEWLQRDVYVCNIMDVILRGKGKKNPPRYK